MAKKPQTIVETEWSYFVDVNSLDKDRTAFDISPNEAERKRLCQRLGLVSIEALDAELVVARRAGEVAYHVTGSFKAEITQSCVVTLEPVQSTVSEEFEAWFADPEAAIPLAKARHDRLNEKGHGELPILEESEDPEPLIEGKIDLGELVTQYMALTVNPYPHAEGVEFEQGDDQIAKPDDALTKSPFAALKDWKDKLAGGEDA